MTREIKFRAWDKVQHKLMSVVEMDWEPHGTDEHGNFKREVYYVRAQNIKDFADVEHYCGVSGIEELMFEQYTGLHDVNGKEIFVGDIVQMSVFYFSSDDKVGCVEYHQQYGYSIITNNRRLRQEYWVNEDQPSYKIIGNIHENPELLGGN